MEDNHSALIRQAVQQARQGKPQEALTLLLQNPVPDSSNHAVHYHHTLGSLLLNQGRIREAYAHLDVAHYRGGGSSVMESAWRRAQDEVHQRYGEETLNQASTPLEKWVDHPVSLPLEALTAVAALVFSISCFRRNATPAARRARLRWSALAWLIALSLTITHHWGTKNARARASQEVFLRSGPSEDFLRLERIEAGVELRALERKTGWLRVRVRNRVAGWVPEDHVLLFRAPSTTREL